MFVGMVSRWIQEAPEREVPKEPGKVHMRVAVKSQTVYFGGFCPSFINVIKTL